MEAESRHKSRAGAQFSTAKRRGGEGRDLQSVARELLGCSWVREIASPFERERGNTKINARQLNWLGGGVGQHLHKSRTGARFLAACANRIGHRGRRSKLVALPPGHPRAAAERILGNAVRVLAAPERPTIRYLSAIVGSCENLEMSMFTI